MKYIVIDDCGSDVYDEEFETKEEALAYAEHEWDCLTGADKKRRKAFYVLESINPDVEAENHFDGNPVKTFK